MEYCIWSNVRIWSNDDVCNALKLVGHLFKGGTSLQDIIGFLTGNVH